VHSWCESILGEKSRARPAGFQAILDEADALLEREPFHGDGDSDAVGQVSRVDRPKRIERVSAPHNIPAGAFSESGKPMPDEAKGCLPGSAGHGEPARLRCSLRHLDDCHLGERRDHPAKAYIYELYRGGGSLSSLLEGEYFNAIRSWQDGYLKGRERMENLFLPCPMRDHYGFAHQLVTSQGAKPMDENAAAALSDLEYRGKMMEYNGLTAELLDPVWQREVYPGQEGAQR